MYLEKTLSVLTVIVSATAGYYEVTSRCPGLRGNAAFVCITSPLFNSGGGKKKKGRSLFSFSKRA